MMVQHQDPIFAYSTKDILIFLCVNNIIKILTMIILRRKNYLLFDFPIFPSSLFKYACKIFIEWSSYSVLFLSLCFHTSHCLPFWINPLPCSLWSLILGTLTHPVLDLSSSFLPQDLCSWSSARWSFPSSLHDWFTLIFRS